MILVNILVFRVILDKQFSLITVSLEPEAKRVFSGSILLKYISRISEFCRYTQTDIILLLFVELSLQEIWHDFVLSKVLTWLPNRTLDVFT